MANDNETVADICTKMRYGAVPKHRTDNELLWQYADRIESAHKREVVEAATKAATYAINLTNEKRSRETVDIESRCIYGEAVEHRSGGFVYDFHDVLKRLESVCWHETMFADMQTYYAEEGVYVMRCKHGTPNEHYCIIRAKSLDEAISRAVFDLHKANESREVGVAESATPTSEMARNILGFVEEAMKHTEDMYLLTCLDQIETLAQMLLLEGGESANKPTAVDTGVNMAKMREALKAVVKVGYPHNFQREAPHIRGYCYDITKAIEKCYAALSAPPRNCDLARDWLHDLYVNFKPPASVRREMPPEWVDAVMAFCLWLVKPVKEGGAAKCRQ